MLILKRLICWVGERLKGLGMKLLGESTASSVQSDGSACNVGNSAQLTIGYWNVHKNAGALPYIASLACDLQKNTTGGRNGVLLGLSEVGNLNLSSLLGTIKTLTNDNSWTLHQSPSQRFVCFSNVPIVITSSEAARGWPVIINLNEPNSPTPTRCAVWFVHMRAPMMTFNPENVSSGDAQNLHKEIIDLEGNGLGATVAIGDFNLDPYSSSMLGPDHLNAVMCRKVASQGSIVYDKGQPYSRTRPYFYNPMWGSLGDQSSNNQPGSFYRGRDPGNSNEWHLIDQVLLRPSLIPRIIPESARVLVRVENTSLLDARQRVDTAISDHLPVVISLYN